MNLMTMDYKTWITMSWNRSSIVKASGWSGSRNSISRTDSNLPRVRSGTLGSVKEVRFDWCHGLWLGFWSGKHTHLNHYRTILFVSREEIEPFKLFHFFCHVRNVHSITFRNALASIWVLGLLLPDSVPNSFGSRPQWDTLDIGRRRHLLRSLLWLVCTPNTDPRFLKLNILSWCSRKRGGLFFYEDLLRRPWRLSTRCSWRKLISIPWKHKRKARISE